MKRRSLKTQLVVKLFPSVPKGIWIHRSLTDFLEKHVFYREFSVSFGKALLIASGALLLGIWSVVALAVNLQSVIEARAYKQEANDAQTQLRRAQRDFVTLYSRLKPMERQMLEMDRISTGISTILGVDFGQSRMTDPDEEERMEEIEAAMAVLTARFDALGTFWKDQQTELARTPSISPVRDKFWITSRFGYRRNPWTAQGGPQGAGRQFHSALDMACDPGTPIYASADGVVEFAGRVSGKRSMRLSLYGNHVIVDHGNGFKTAYAHCQELQVEKGQKVRRGDLLATVGSTGRSTGPHLHYEVLLNDQPVDPEFYILDRVMSGRGVISRIELGHSSELYAEHEKIDR